MREELNWVTGTTDESKEIKGDIPTDLGRSYRSQVMDILRSRQASFFVMGVNVPHIFSPPESNAELTTAAIGVSLVLAHLASHIFRRRVS